MNIYTIKFSKKKAVCIILIAALLIALLILAWPNGQAATTPDGTQTAAVVEITNGDDCRDYIASLGYAVSGDALDTREVVIPKEFDQTYLKYNDLQKECGFDLLDYTGKKVTLYTYQVTNYADQPDTLVDVLVYKEQVIGGAVYTASIDGFMHGLKPNPTLQ